MSEVHPQPLSLGGVAADLPKFGHAAWSGVRWACAAVLGAALGSMSEVHPQPLSLGGVAADLPKFGHAAWSGVRCAAHAAKGS